MFVISRQRSPNRFIDVIMTVDRHKTRNFLTPKYVLRSQGFATASQMVFDSHCPDSYFNILRENLEGIIMITYSDLLYNTDDRSSHSNPYDLSPVTYSRINYHVFFKDVKA